MPNTSNQSLPYPSPTDPVNVPGDIQALAEAIDTKLLDKAVVDAKGDLIVGVADNTIDNLNVGANNTVLVADSTNATFGMKWATLTDASLASNAVSTAKIQDSAVTTAKIADLNVTTGKIADGSVTTAKMVDANVTTAKIADAAVTTAKIADANVTTAKIADGSVTAAKIAGGAIPSSVPTGVVSPYAGSTAPAGYLLCDGSAVSRTTYSALFAVIGTTYGAGDGSTTFAVPDLRSRFVAGRGTATWSDALAETGGTKDAVVVSHTHTTPSHSHDASIGGGDHFHTYNVRTDMTAGGSSGSPMISNNTGNPNSRNTDIGGHSHTISVTGGSGATIAAPTGAVSGTDQNLPPYITLNHIIKT